MEKDKPWALMSEKGLKQGFLEGNWHNEATLSNRLQQQRVPSKRPATRPKNPGHVRVGRLPCSWSIQYSVLSLLFSLKVVANGGLGIDHLGGWRWPTRLVQSAVPLQLLPRVCFWHRHRRLPIVEWNDVQMPQTEACCDRLTRQCD